VLLTDVLPAAIAWHPGDGDSVLLGATAEDLVVVESVLATLPAKARGQVFVEVECASDIRELAAPGRVCVTWLCRDRGQSLAAALEAWLAEMLPVEGEREHRVYSWVSGDRTAHARTSA
jgi:NADPH-dependent ferric siderophore reductase